MSAQAWARWTRKAPALMGAVIVLACAVAYSNAWRNPFVFDDCPNICENPSIFKLYPLGRLLSSSRSPGDSVSGRPLLQVSLALNFAVSGLDPWSYHAANLVIHAAAALFLFGIARRSLARKPKVSDRAALILAFFIALIWAVHPLNTEAVTYVIQRGESLMGLCFLAALYFAVRSWHSRRALPWQIASLGAYLAGIGVKEVIVALPLAVLCYDMVFNSCAPREALGRSKVLYAGLFLGWILLFYLAWSTGLGEARTGPLPYTWWQWLVIQTEVIWHYVRLAVWPDSLCLDYGLWPVPGFWRALPGAAGLAALAGLSAWGVWRKNPLGFCGAWFFLILAPTSSVMPLADPAFEHRMYLPLASLAAVAVAGAHGLCIRLLAARPQTRYKALAALAVCGLAVVLCLTAATMARNRVYASPVSLWSDTLKKAPGNPRAYCSLAYALVEEGKARQARGLYYQALAQDPGYGHAHYNLANLLARSGNLEEAVLHYKKALVAEPDDPAALSCLGAALGRLGKGREAEKFLLRAVSVCPGHARAHANLGIFWASQGRLAGAVAQLRQAHGLDPGNGEITIRLAQALEKASKDTESLALLEKVLAASPRSVEARLALGKALAARGWLDGAAYHFEKILAQDPGNQEAIKNLHILSKAQK